MQAFTNKAAKTTSMAFDLSTAHDKCKASSSLLYHM